MLLILVYVNTIGDRDRIFFFLMLGGLFVNQLFFLPSALRCYLILAAQYIAISLQCVYYRSFTVVSVFRLVILT